MPKGEIQNRDRDEASELSGIPHVGGLGELPEDLANERGDMDGYSARVAENGSPDMASAQRSRVDAHGTGLGSPKIDYGVRSIYDSRPVNHREFNLWFQRALGVHADPLDFSFAKNLWFVPQGYVAVLREVTVIVPPAVTLGNFDGTMEILVNGASVDPLRVQVGAAVALSTPEQILIPWRSNAPVNTFIIADQANSVGLNLTFVSASALTEGQLQIGFFGQFLLKTGVPAQFQAANEAGRARVAVTTSKSDLSGVSSGDGVNVRRRKKVAFPNVPILRG